MGDMFRPDLGHLQALVKIQIQKKLLKCNVEVKSFLGSVF